MLRSSDHYKIAHLASQHRIRKRLAPHQPFAVNISKIFILAVRAWQGPEHVANTPSKKNCNLVSLLASPWTHTKPSVTSSTHAPAE